MTLNDAVKLLKPNDLVQLTYAFENGFSQVVFLDNGYFVSVHSNVPAIEKQGVWSLGQIPQKE